MPRDYSPGRAQPTDHQRRPEHLRGDEWIRAFLRDAKIARIATAREGQPFVNPTMYWFDEEQDRIIFHSNVAGRVRANVEANPQVCIEISEMGKFLPANVALEFSLQYRSAAVFGTARLLTDPVEQRRALHSLIAKYFPLMQLGQEYRPVTDAELKRTSVYAVQIESWSGKENWQDRADQSDEWPALDEKWFE